MILVDNDRVSLNVIDKPLDSEQCSPAGDGTMEHRHHGSETLGKNVFGTGGEAPHSDFQYLSSSEKLK